MGAEEVDGRRTRQAVEKWTRVTRDRRLRVYLLRSSRYECVRWGRPGRGMLGVEEGVPFRVELSNFGSTDELPSTTLPLLLLFLSRFSSCSDPSLPGWLALCRGRWPHRPRGRSLWSPLVVSSPLLLPRAQTFGIAELTRPSDSSSCPLG